ncbi:type-F conjugative transfer system protein TraW [Candidatus Paracaedibacter symbiosus]|uniref:type-F conjugative transfer system protein TraW n=1 Tax=Candidatus Paracaedibacter symbiosus TaxID=244582 RepID=UPI001E28E4B6|nr:type-F conjugative transfer system protein TraW [Candidatus Paracaedibacter symbiosus]
MLLLAVLGNAQVQAKNLGVHGPVFEIVEKSLLAVIEERLKGLQSSNKMALHQQELQEKMSKSVERPVPVGGIIKATKYQLRDYDPTFVVSQDIKDHKGQFIAKKGSSFNPLDSMSFGIPLVFIDGDDTSQVQWALQQQGKIVLINGAPLHLEKAYKRTFYFDQGSVLTTKFGIGEVPARVSQKENKLIIETVPLYKGNANG